MLSLDLKAWVTDEIKSINLDSGRLTGASLSPDRPRVLDSALKRRWRSVRKRGVQLIQWEQEQWASSDWRLIEPEHSSAASAQRENFTFALVEAENSAGFYLSLSFVSTCSFSDQSPLNFTLQTSAAADYSFFITPLFSGTVKEQVFILLCDFCGKEARLCCLNRNNSCLLRFSLATIKFWLLSQKRHFPLSFSPSFFKFIIWKFWLFTEKLYLFFTPWFWLCLRILTHFLINLTSISQNFNFVSHSLTTLHHII